MWNTKFDIFFYKNGQVISYNTSRKKKSLSSVWKAFIVKSRIDVEQGDVEHDVS